MKDKILMLLLGIFTAFSISAGIVSGIVTATPATPKSTIVKTFRTAFGMEEDIAAYIRSNVSNGYIVKSVAIMEDANRSKGIVVMEKY